MKTFEGPGFEDLQVTRCRKYSTFSTFGDESFIQRNMKSIWSLMNDPHSSELAKVKHIIVINRRKPFAETMDMKSLAKKAAWVKLPFPRSTRCRFDVVTTLLTSKQRCYNVETTSCVYWVLRISEQ